MSLGGKPNYEAKDGRTALITASMGGKVGAIEELIRQTAFVDYENKNAETALMVAITAGEKESVSALMVHGAKVDYENRQGQNALIVAAATGNVALIETLLDYGAQVLGLWGRCGRGKCALGARGLGSDDVMHGYTRQLVRT